MSEEQKAARRAYRHEYQQRPEYRDILLRKKRQATKILNARKALQGAIRRGKIVRPETCERCGDKPEPAIDGASRIHGHHANGYDHPFEVEWLCAPCHRREHLVHAYVPAGLQPADREG